MKIRHTLITLLLLAMPFVASAAPFEVDGIYYETSGGNDATVVTKADGSYAGHIIIPESVTYNKKSYPVVAIDGVAFYNCTGLTSVSIPKSITTIGNQAFEGCTNLENVYITDLAAWCNIQFPGYNPLQVAENLYWNEVLVTNLVIPGTVTTINTKAFYGYKKLNSVVIPGSVTTVGNNAFEACTGLTTVTLGEGLTTIGSAAFLNCTSLTDITMPKSLTIVGGDGIYGAFGNCTSLSNVYISDVAAWCNADFNSIDDNPLYFAKNLYLNGELITHLVIPEGVTKINHSIFMNCSNITAITIPKSLTATGIYSFLQCRNLKDIYITDLAAWCNIDFHPYDGRIMEYAQNLYLNNKLVVDLIIPDGVETIKSYSFLHYKKLKTVTIPASVTSIGEDAFNGSSSISIVDVRATTPPITEWDSFDNNIYSKAKLIVPVGCVDTYNADNNWKHFSIEEYKAMSTLTLLANETQGTVSGSGTYANGAEITITATPYNGYFFTQWSDGNTNNPRTLTIAQHTTLTAEFGMVPYELIVETNDASMGRVTGGGTYKMGAIVKIEAIANEGYHFVQWSDGNTNNPRTIVINGNMTLTAQFILSTFNLSLKSNDATLGSVVGEGGTYHKNDEITAMAVPKGGVTFVEWSDGNTDNPRTIKMTADMDLTARFDQPNSMVTATVNNANLGKVSQSVVLEATPIVYGAYFSKWSDGNTDNPRTITSDEDMTLTAEFILPTDLETVNGNAISVTAMNREIIISGAAEGIPVAVYTTNGTEVYRGTDHRIALANEGLYLVRVANETYKVVL